MNLNNEVLKQNDMRQGRFMSNSRQSIVQRLLLTCCTPAQCTALLQSVKVFPRLMEEAGSDTVSRAVLAQTLNLLLFHDLLDRVPTAKQYVEERAVKGKHIVFDHGALRTVALSGMGDLPAGDEAIARVLLPLGYKMSAVYPLDRLRMTGRSYTHVDYPEELPQFFVSELHPERFSAEFQAAVVRVTASSRDPLTASAKQLLNEMDARGALSFDQAAALLPVLLACFQRQHGTPY